MIKISPPHKIVPQSKISISTCHLIWWIKVNIAVLQSNRLFSHMLVPISVAHWSCNYWGLIYWGLICQSLIYWMLIYWSHLLKSHLLKSHLLMFHLLMSHLPASFFAAIEFFYFPHKHHFVEWCKSIRWKWKIFCDYLLIRSIVKCTSFLKDQCKREIKELLCIFKVSRKYTVNAARKNDVPPGWNINVVVTISQLCLVFHSYELQ